MNATEFLRAKAERDFLGEWETLPRFRDLPVDQYAAYEAMQQRNLRRAQLSAALGRHEADKAKQALFEAEVARAYERDGW